MEFTIADALNTSITGFIVVLIILALLACIIVVLSKIIRIFTEKDKKKSEKVSAAQESPVTAPQTVQPSGALELYKVDEKTAATVMAIVSHNSDIPLERLQFKSIRLVEPELETYKTDDKTAAVIMALVSHNSGIPLERLQFKTIKLIENS